MTAAAGSGGWPVWALPLAFFLLIAFASAVLRRVARRRAARGIPPKVPTTRQVANGATVVGVLCAAAGLALFVAYTGRPVYRAARAGSWPTTAGVVLGSRLESSHGSKGTTYRIDVRYRYAVDGNRYESNQYDASGTHLRTSAGYNGMRAVVAAHPPGTRVTVHYDARDPADAMLDTRVPRYLLTYSWVPLVFVAFGGVTIVAVRRAARLPDVPTARTTPVLAGRNDSRAPLPSDAPVTLHNRPAHRKAFVFLLAFSLVWNGSIVGFFVQTRDWFLIPFLAVGVLVVLLTTVVGVGLLAPPVTVTLPHAPLRTGERVKVRFAVGGDFTAVESLAFRLEGREQTASGDGDDRVTRRHVAYRIPVYETARAADTERGRFEFTIPLDAMTTFAAPNNRFTWHLCCDGRVRWRPRIAEDFEIGVVAGGPAHDPARGNG